jgi:hypothetical protein
MVIVYLGSESLRSHLERRRRVAHLGIEGRSKMNKAQLQRAVDRKKG